MKEYTVYYVSKDGFHCWDFFYGEDRHNALHKFCRKHPDCRDIIGCDLGFPTTTTNRKLEAGKEQT